MTAPIIRAPFTLKQLSKNMPQTGAHTLGNAGSSMLLFDMATGLTADITNTWAPTLGGTGAFAQYAGYAEGPFLRLNDAAGSDTVKIITRAFVPNPTALGARGTFMWSKCVLEWVARVDNLTNVENGTFGMGFYNAGNTWVGRTTAGLAAFCLSSDAIVIVNDKAGTETVTTPTSPPTMGTTPIKFRIELVWKQTTPTIDYYINDVQQISTSTNIPNASTLGIGYLCDAEVGGAAALLIQPRCWLEE